MVEDVPNVFGGFLAGTEVRLQRTKKGMQAWRQVSILKIWQHLDTGSNKGMTVACRVVVTVVDEEIE